MFRDSFGNLLHTFLADAYGQAAFSRAMPYTMSLLDQTGADTVLIEIVERNLDWWATQAPIFPAPERVLTGTPPPGEAQASSPSRRTACWPGMSGWRAASPERWTTIPPSMSSWGSCSTRPARWARRGRGPPSPCTSPRSRPRRTPEILYQFEGQL